MGFGLPRDRTLQKPQSGIGAIKEDALFSLLLVFPRSPVIGPVVITGLMLG